MLEKEREEIKRRYARRSLIVRQPSGNDSFALYMVAERERVYKKLLCSCFPHFYSLKMLEVGAGAGSNLPFFHQLGIPWKNIYANELLEERSHSLSVLHPEAHLLKGNALDIDLPDGVFDIVFQSTVFTSILDMEFRRVLAAKMLRLLKKQGAILWYDFKYDNPYNRDVKGVTKKEIINLFPGVSSAEFHNVTLAPPLGRRVGNLYPLINSLFPFLRTHIVAVLKK